MGGKTKQREEKKWSYLGFPCRERSALGTVPALGGAAGGCAVVGLKVTPFLHSAVLSLIEAQGGNRC